MYSLYTYSIDYAACLIQSIYSGVYNLYRVLPYTLYSICCIYTIHSMLYTLHLVNIIYIYINIYIYTHLDTAYENYLYTMNISV